MAQQLWLRFSHLCMKCGRTASVLVLGRWVLCAQCRKELFG